MANEFIDSMKEDMAGAINALNTRLSSVRAGRASPQLISGVDVDVKSYGATMPLQQLATITAADARLLVVTPWDKSVISDIEKGIIAAQLGLNPSNDGSVVRVPIPPLTAERRRDLARKARDFGEDSRVVVRNFRRQYNDLFKEMEKDKEISEDELARLLKQVQDATDAAIARINEVIAAKEKEINEG